MAIRVNTSSFVIFAFLLAICDQVNGLFWTFISDDEEMRRVVFVVYWLIMGFIAIELLIVRAMHKTLYGSIIGISLQLILLLISVASILWSFSVYDTLLDVFKMFILFTMAFALVQITDMDRFLRILLIFLFTFSLLALFLYAAGVESVRYVDENRRLNLLGWEPFMGFNSHKVYFSTHMCIGLVIAVGWVKRTSVKVLVSSVFVICILLSGSSTGLVLLPLIAGLFLFRGFVAEAALRYPMALIFFTAGVFALGFYLFMALGLGEMVERSSTLTGRTEIWDAAFRLFAERPFLGWGINGFLNGESGPFFWFYHVDYYVPVNMQNGYLEYLVGTGLVGFTILLVLLVAAVRRSVILTYRHFDGGVMYRIFVVIAVSAFVESILSGGYIGLFFIFLVLCVGRDRARQSADDVYRMKGIGRVTL